MEICIWRSAYASMKHLSEQVLLCNPASFRDKREHGEINHFSTAWQHFGLMWITHPLGQTSRSSRAVALARNGPFSPPVPCQVLGPYGWKLHSYGKQMCSKAIAKLHESIREEVGKGHYSESGKEDSFWEWPCKSKRLFCLDECNECMSTH